MAVKKNTIIALTLSKKFKLVTAGVFVADGSEDKPENKLRQEINRNCQENLYNEISFSKTVFYSKFILVNGSQG